MLSQQNAVRGNVAPADAPAQLVQLRQSEPLGMFNDHQGCLWDVNTHFDHCCGNQDINALFQKTGHDLIFIPGFETAVNQADLAIREDILLQMLRHAGGVL